MAKRKGYKEIVLEHFKRFEYITTWDAFEMYGMTRLSAVIYNLKKDGYVFEDKMITEVNKYGNKITIKGYKLIK